jgi:regulator of sigma E protease
VIFSFKKGETQYSIRLLPLGGYVMMFGEETSIEGLNIPLERSLLGISKPKRALVMAAGIILNLALAFVLFLTSNIGVTQRQDPFRHQLNVVSNSIAETSLLTSDDVIDRYVGDPLLGVGEVTVNEFDATLIYFVEQLTSTDQDLVSLLTIGSYENNVFVKWEPTRAGDRLMFTLPILRYDGERYVRRDVIMEINTVLEGATYRLEDSGATVSPFFPQRTFAQALRLAGEDWTRGLTLIVNAVGDLLRGQNLDQVGGIVAIYSTASLVLTDLGFGWYIFLWGLISVNLAVFNLLPFPGLDGWHLLVITIEGITRREISPKIKNSLSMIGFLILLSLMLFLIVKDILALTMLLV